MRIDGFYKICRLDLWVHPIFDELVTQSRLAELSVLPSRGDETFTLAGLRRANAYHVSAAKDELPRQWFVSRELIRECPNLLCVSSSGAGFDTIDVAACTEAGVPVVNQAGMNADSVAELTFALLLAVERRVVLSHTRLRMESGFTRESLMGHEIRGKCLGLVGIGEIGRRVAHIAQGFGMEVIAFDPLLDPVTIRARGAEPVDFETLLKRAEVVSLHCPLDERTRGMFGATEYAAMKPGAVFLSTARGAYTTRRRCTPPWCRNIWAARAWTFGCVSRRATTRPCCSCPMWWPLSIPRASRMKPGVTWRVARPSNY